VASPAGLDLAVCCCRCMNMGCTVVACPQTLPSLAILKETLIASFALAKKCLSTQSLLSDVHYKTKRVTSVYCDMTFGDERWVEMAFT